MKYVASLLTCRFILCTLASNPIYMAALTFSVLFSVSIFASSDYFSTVLSAVMLSLLIPNIQIFISARRNVQTQKNYAIKELNYLKYRKCFILALSVVEIIFVSLSFQIDLNGFSLLNLFYSDPLTALFFTSVFFYIPILQTITLRDQNSFEEFTSTIDYALKCEVARKYNF